MGLYQWLCLIGIPSLTALIVGVVFANVKAKIIHNEQMTDSVRKGVQALLRSQLYHCWERCSMKGFATIEERENFENLYVQYHNMGQNGVMDNIRQKFLSLPIIEGESNQ